jgi:hypothetical protein
MIDPNEYIYSAEYLTPHLSIHPTYARDTPQRHGCVTYSSTQ